MSAPVPAPGQGSDPNAHAHMGPGAGERQLYVLFNRGEIEALVDSFPLDGPCGDLVYRAVLHMIDFDDLEMCARATDHCIEFGVTQAEAERYVKNYRVGTGTAAQRALCKKMWRAVNAFRKPSYPDLPAAGPDAPDQTFRKGIHLKGWVYEKDETDEKDGKDGPHDN